jgi:tetratricopeptide (TPR) repeat protein
MTSPNTGGQGLFRGPDSAIPQLPQLGLATKTDDVFARELETFRAPREDHAPSIVIPDLPNLELEIDSRTTAEQEPADAARLLSGAESLIKRGQFAEALEVLGRVPQSSARYPKALFLSAHCHASLGNDLDALRYLAEFQRAVGQWLGKRLTGPMRAGIRHRAVPMLALRTARLLAAQQSGKAVTLLEDYVEADPGCATFSFLLAGVLSQSGHTDRAVTVVDHALRAGPGRADQRRLTDLREQVLSAVARQRLDPARSHFLQGRYGPAREALRNADPKLRGVALYRLFDSYLERVAGGQRGRPVPNPQAEPPGTPRENDNLYFFLVGDLIRQASAKLEAGNLGAARDLLQQALRHCPRFPYANYLYANCLYALTAQLTSGTSEPSAQTVIRNLLDARDALRIAKADPDVAAVAGEALAVVEELTREVDKAGGPDLAVLNPLIADFNEITTSISSSNLAEVRARLVSLKQRIAPVRAELTTAEGRRRLSELETSINAHIGALTTAASVRSLISRYESAVTGWQRSPLSSRQEVAQAQDLMRQLRKDARAARASLKEPNARKQLDQLLQAIDAIERELRSAGR